MDSAIEGGDGNHEFFVHAVQGASIENLDEPLPTSLLRLRPSASRALCCASSSALT